jgi:hypothetical protein
MDFFCEGRITYYHYRYRLFRAPLGNAISENDANFRFTLLKK